MIHVSEAAFPCPLTHIQADLAHHGGPTATPDDLDERSADVYRPNDGSVAKMASKAPLRVENRTREMAVLRPEC